MYSKEMLLDADVFISYIGEGDNLSVHSEKVIEEVLNGRIGAKVSSIIYDDIVTALRSKSISLEEVIKFLAGMASIPYEPLPLNPSISVNAMNLYNKYGGSRRLHYFDSYHVASALQLGLPLITSDSFIIEHKRELGVSVLDLKNF